MSHFVSIVSQNREKSLAGWYSLEHNGTENSESADVDLTDRQVASLPYLVASTSVSEGARLANIGRATLVVVDDFFISVPAV